MPKKAPIQPSVNYKCGYPISIFILLLLPMVLGIVALIYKAHNIGLLTYLLLGMGCFYFLFVRHSCKVSVKDNVMEIAYFEPWKKDLKIDVSIYKYVHFGRSYYSFLAENSMGFSLARLFYCFDLLLLSENPNQVQLEIRMNIRMFGFSRLIEFLHMQRHLTKRKLSGSSVIIW